MRFSPCGRNSIVPRILYRGRWAAVAAVLALGGACGSQQVTRPSLPEGNASEDALVSPSEDERLNFVDHIRPMMQVFCVNCHGSARHIANLAFDTFESTLSDLSTEEKWQRALARMQEKSMPPRGKLQPRAEHSAMLQRWIADGMPLSAEAVNPADKDSALKALPSPTRRLSNFELSNSLRDLLGAEVIAAAEDELQQLPADDGGKTFDTVATTSSDDFVLASFAVLEKIGDFLLKRKRKLAALVGCQLGKAKIDTSEECQVDFLTRFGKRAFRRPLTEDELNGLLALARPIAGAGKFVAMIKALLMSPNFLYLITIGGQPTADERILALTPLDLATRLSFALLGTTPDENLLHAAESGGLASPAGLEAVIDSLLARPQARRNWEHFADQWFRARAGHLPNIDERLELRTAERDALRASIISEPGKIFSEIVFGREGNFSDLFQTDIAYIDNKHLAAIYDIPSSDKARFVALSDTKRHGILSRALFLVSEKQNSSIIQRGVRVRETFLCDEFEQPAFDAETEQKIKETFANLSLSPRERVDALTRNQPCVNCHSLINPAGFALGGFDTFGRARNIEDEYEVVDGQPRIVASFPVNTKVTAAMDTYGPKAVVDGAAEYSQIMGDSSKARFCFVRQWLRYVTGASDSAEIIPSVRKLQTALVIDNPSLRQFIKDFFMTEAFRSRREP